MFSYIFCIREDIIQTPYPKHVHTHFFESKKNLILVSSICKSNYSIFFNKQVVIKKNDSFIYLGSLVNNFYLVTPLSILLSNKNNHISLEKKKNLILIKHIFGTYL